MEKDLQILLLLSTIDVDGMDSRPRQMELIHIKLNPPIDSNMIKFAFLKLFPCGNFTSGNLVLNECYAASKQDAVKVFQQNSPIALDGEGYGKQGEFSYCVAECY